MVISSILLLGDALPSQIRTQSQTIAHKIKSHETWIEPKFICSKELDKKFYKKQLHI